MVLVDSLFGKSSSFIQTLERYELPYVVAVRSNHGVWIPSGQTVKANRWHKFERTFSNQTSESRYIREVIFGKRRKVTYWEITTGPETLPENFTSFVMTNITGKINDQLGNLYGLRMWGEYGFRQCKQELGWTDYRFTKFKQIEKWWEIVFSVYLMISLNSKPSLSLHQLEGYGKAKTTVANLSFHQHWNHGNGWKSCLNNLRLIVQPTILLWLISPWLDIFPNHDLLIGFHNLIQAVAKFHPDFSSG